MFMIAMPLDFKVGDSRECMVDGKPARLTWRDQFTLVIEPDDVRKIVFCEQTDKQIDFICGDADGTTPIVIRVEQP